MFDARDLEKKAARLHSLVRDRFGVDQPDLAKAARKLGRRVPKKVRAALISLQDARQRARHPKLRLQIEPRALEADFATASGYLEAVDKADRRKGAILGVLGGLSFNLIALFVVVVLVLMWRGLI